jgi:EmrB/QacA subfamily drug resistance transporter
MKTDQSVHLQGKSSFPWIILLIILMAPLITVIDVFIMNVSLSTIQSFFHASDAGIQGIIASYLVGYAVFLITGSRAGDYFGRKKIFIIGLTAFTIASALCGLAGTIPQLIVFRFLQGIAAGFAVPQTVTLIQLNFISDEHRSKALGFYGITLGIASILGQFLGGYFVTTHFMFIEGWRLIFLINVPIGVVAVLMAAYFIPESRQRNKARFDMGGVVLLTAALSALIYPIIQGRELGWPLWTILMLLFSFVLLWAFIRYENKRISKNRDVLMPMQLFRIRTFNVVLGMVFFYFAVHSTFMMTCALFLQRGHHMAPFTAGCYFVILGVSFMLSSHWSIRNAARYGNKVLYGAGLTVLISFIAQFIWFNTALSPVIIVFSFITYGLGAGILMPSFMKIALKDVPADQAGLASGIYSTIQQFSSALGISMLGGIFFYTAEKHGDFDLAYKSSLAGMLLYMLIMIFLCYVLQAKKVRRVKQITEIIGV